MCLEHLELIRAGRESADELIAGLVGEPVLKAMDLNTKRGFDRAVSQLAASLRRAARGEESKALREAMKRLDVDWASVDAATRLRLITQAVSRLDQGTSRITPLIAATLGGAATQVINATRKQARRRGLRIAVDWNALDRRIARHLVRTQANFVTDEYGRRHKILSDKMREIVRESLEEGLGRDDIASKLRDTLGAQALGRSPFYFETVAGAFVANGRSFGQLSSYAEAGIARYRIEAVLDERTTEICRFLHGKVFTVDAGLRRFDLLDSSGASDGVKDLQPWVRQRKDPKTGEISLVVRRGQREVKVTDVTRSGFGSWDDRGEHRNSLNERQLMDLGVSFPPYHGLCRTTTVPEV